MITPQNSGCCHTLTVISLPFAIFLPDSASQVNGEASREGCKSLWLVHHPGLAVFTCGLCWFSQFPQTYPTAPHPMATGLHPRASYLELHLFPIYPCVMLCLRVMCQPGLPGLLLLNNMSCDVTLYNLIT